ncbi:sulfurtransferase TusA family protein [Methylobacterium sp. NEAU 140]|uniref:sulfurtransferase TusA family protein n=1 Tax=Methylobacterium sp. NEAU 140 TaxID=3064945 RepID=UPI00273453EE|nr:sulfurtransferase TusA family protein [Methylobacterium sp. NEAU 140]MDP4021224.1 sulfurtransferase TusA family protein [Methylobacterium sp. NEAU 140]
MDDGEPGYQSLDLSGLKCPLPVLRTRKALRALPAGRGLLVTCTDPMAVIDIPNLLREEGARLDAVERRGDRTRFRITASAKPPHS